MGRSRGKLWYRKGLRFECTQCGNCCTGTSGLVEFTDDEGRAMAQLLGLEYEAFLGDYARPFAGGWALLESPSTFENQHDCIFLERDSQSGKAACRVHAARPQQCRTWPFWPDNLKSPRTWKKAARNCEGIDRGPLVKLEQIREERQATPRAGAVRRPESSKP